MERDPVLRFFEGEVREILFKSSGDVDMCWMLYRVYFQLSTNAKVVKQLWAQIHQSIVA